MTNLRALEVPAVGSPTARLWSERLAVRAAFIVFLVVRLTAFANDPLLEDHDSVSYLESAKALMSLDPDFQMQWDGNDYYMYADCGIGYVYRNLAAVIWETM